jgi:putative addiction module component (TIGR02574 family)
MVESELKQRAMKLSAEDRLDLARQLVESVVTPEALSDSVSESMRRIDDIASGRVAGLSEEEFRAALK